MTNTPKTIESYKTIVFDCDGVILNSNELKTEAFGDVARQFSNKAAEELVEFHVNNGGISRNVKFKFLVEELLGLSDRNDLVNQLCTEYGDLIEEKLLECEIASEIYKLKDSTPGSTWFVVSGGNQEQLRRVFNARGIADLFDGGIFGSPSSKDEILHTLTSNKAISNPAIFLGDSKYDFAASKNAGLDFIFLHGWTELRDWETYCATNNIRAEKNIANLINFHEY